MTKANEELGDRVQDYVAMASRGVLGAIPFAGPMLAELVQVTIPNHRLERLERYVGKLGARLKQLEDAALAAENIRISPYADIAEDTLHLVVRAASDTRLDYLASFLASTLTLGETKALERKHLLQIIGELNDTELIILRGYVRSSDHDEFRDLHEDVLRPRTAHLGSSPEEVEAKVLHDSYKEHLIRLGLLKRNFRSPRRSELPELDKETGMIKESYKEITLLGEMVLKTIGLIEHTRVDGRQR